MITAQGNLGKRKQYLTTDIPDGSVSENKLSEAVRKLIEEELSIAPDSVTEEMLTEALRDRFDSFLTEIPDGSITEERLSKGLKTRLDGFMTEVLNGSVTEDKLSEELTAKVNKTGDQKTVAVDDNVIRLVNAGIAQDGQIPQMQGGVLVWKDLDTTEIDELKSVAATHTSRITALQERASRNESDIGGLQSKIDTLIDENEGSIKDIVTEEINTFAQNISDDGIVNTFKELVDYVAEHAPETAQMAKDISDNKSAVEELKVKMVSDEYVDSAINNFAHNGDAVYYVGDIANHVIVYGIFDENSLEYLSWRAVVKDVDVVLYGHVYHINHLEYDGYSGDAGYFGAMLTLDNSGNVRITEGTALDNEPYIHLVSFNTSSYDGVYNKSYGEHVRNYDCFSYYRYIESRITALEDSYGECETLAEQIVNGEV